MTIPTHAKQLLTASAIRQKLNRMAYQILEWNYGCNEIVLLGIEGGGGALAEIIKKEIQHIDASVRLYQGSISIHKTEPLHHPIKLEGIESDELMNKSIVLIDDVGNTGKTLFYALSVLQGIAFQRMTVALLVDRTHKKFPIQAAIVGQSLATTLNEHIHVVIEEDGIPSGAYLF